MHLSNDLNYAEYRATLYNQTDLPLSIQSLLKPKCKLGFRPISRFLGWISQDKETVDLKFLKRGTVLSPFQTIPSFGHFETVSIHLSLSHEPTFITDRSMTIAQVKTLLAHNTDTVPVKDRAARILAEDVRSSLDVYTVGIAQRQFPLLNGWSHHRR